MKRLWQSPLPALLLLIGCAVLGYLALHEHAEIVRVDLEFKRTDQAARDHLAVLRQQLTSLQAAQRQAEKMADQSDRPPSANHEPLTIHLSDIAKDHPEYAAILARQQRRNLLQQYGDSFASLNLRPDQLAKLKDLLVERSLTQGDAQQAAKAAGIDQTSPAYWKAVNQATDSVDQELTSVLGTDGAAAIRKLQNLGNSQRLVQQYAPDFADVGAPLTPDQSAALAQAMFNSRPNRVAQGYYQADPTTGLSPSDNQALEDAAKVLSPAQLQVMKTDQIRGNQQNAILAPYFKQINGANMGISIQP